MQVIPAINVSDASAARDQILIARSFLQPDGWIHIDVVDGRFSMNVTWGNPNEFQEFINSNISLRKLNFEIHMMVLDPEQQVEAWLDTGVSRIIVHKESVIDPDFILKKCAEYEATAMMAINPETPADDLKPFLGSYNHFQVLAVKPGWAGQKFDGRVVDKVKFLRENAANVTIEVDGGINPETLRKARSVGADLFVSASYIFGSKTPRRAYEELVEVANAYYNY